MPIIGYNNQTYTRNRNELYGLSGNQFIGSRDEVITPDPKDETVETEQVFSDKGIPGNKIGPIVDTGNAGVTSVGDTDSSIRFWAGSNYDNRATAPFRVDKLGRVYMEDAFIDGYKIFGSTVAADGTGDYATIGAAVTAGETNIFVKNGDYTGSTESITLSSNTTILGESRDGVIVDASFDIRGTLITATGTVTLVNNDATVEGAGVNWSSAQAGDLIGIDDQLYEIDTVTDSDTLELTDPYIGAGGAGISFTIFRAIEKISVRYLTFKNTAAEALRVGYCNEIIITENRFESTYSTNNGQVWGNEAMWNLKISDNLFFASRDSSIYLTNAFLFTISNNFLNHAGYGTATIYNIYVNSSRNGSILNNNITPFYTSVGNSDAILIDGYYITVSGNIIEGKTQIYTGIGTSTTTYYSIISNNIIKGCSNIGINIAGDNNAVNANVTTSNVYGITAAATADRTVIVGNQIYNNSTANLTDSGTNTTATGNITA